MEPVFSHVWTWLADAEQELCGRSAWRQGLRRARGADQTLQYSCVPWLVPFSISPLLCSRSVRPHSLRATALQGLAFSLI
ncbi:hypothetical protein MHYP_G00344260 [Metynnis hypsauchen]